MKQPDGERVLITMLKCDEEKKAEQNIYSNNEDEYCLKLLQEYEEDTDPEKDKEYSLEECEREWNNN